VSASQPRDPAVASDDPTSAEVENPLRGQAVDEPPTEDDAGKRPAREVSRSERVASAVDSWARELVDLGGRNSLLWYRDLPVGTLDLTPTHPSGLAMLLAGRPTRLSTLVREPGSLADARRRCRAIRAKALELAEERGIDACWLAAGMATWSAPESRRAPAAPVLLRPAVLRPRGAAGEDIDIDLGPAAELNPVLVHFLAVEHGVHLDADAIADLALTDDGFDPAPVLREIAAACRAVPGFGVEHRLVIGTFSYARLPMVTDLEAQENTLAGHDVVAALAGDPAALAALAGDPPEPAGDVDPAAEHLVLDADASQQAVIQAVLSGSHLVIKGPPGTGKSQTIANLVASLAAAGRRTLFVAEKRAAIDAVLSRLKSVGLDDLVLDLHDGGSDRRRVAREVALTLDRAGRIARPDVRATEATLVERRTRLTGHAAALHVRRQPWGVSAHDAQLALAGLTGRRPAPRSRVRVRGQALARLDSATLAELREELREAAALGAFRAGPADDPWFGARLATSEEAMEALTKVTDLLQRTLPQACGLLSALLAEAGMPPAGTWDDIGRALALIGSVRATLEVFSAAVFDGSLSDSVAATAEPQWRDERGIVLGWRERRRAVRQARRLLRPGRPPQDLHGALVLAQRQRQEWQDLAGPGSRPRLPSGLDAAERAFIEVAEPLTWLCERLSETAAAGTLTGLAAEDLQARLHDLSERTTSLPVIPRTVALRDRLRAAGLEPLLADLAERDVAVQDVGAELDLVWWTSLLEQVALTDPRYGTHDGDLLRSVAEEFAVADRAHLTDGALRVRRATAELLVAALDRYPEQAALLRTEAARQRRHRPLRDLVRSSQAVLGAAKPCWAMSPLVVSQVLPPGELFDVVIFDEASQVPPAQAVPSISRARQVVVAGDERQLPPTAFFTSAAPDREEGLELTAGVESVLDVLAAALPVARLSWHYRSRDERLVAFANRHLYDGALVTFPGVLADPVLTFEEVDGRGVLAPGADAVESTDAEVARVVELVVEHARARPQESLGVIALGLRHARRVDDALRFALADLPELAEIFSPDRPERFFVKNLERVQGDERDAVILTVGFGRTPHGRVLHRFGPLNQAGGARRLNVAITRARRRMTVVASFASGDLDPARLNAEGARLLREYLSYAASGGDGLEPEVTDARPVGGPDLSGQTGPSLASGAGPSLAGGSPAVLPCAPPSARPAQARTPAQPPDEVGGDPLLDDLRVRLQGHGLRVVPRHGASTARIDLAVGEQTGPLRLAVESDGPGYAAVACTRERDRLRAEQLERLGWRHLRLWSTDIFRDPAREVARVLVALASGRASATVAASGSAPGIEPDPSLPGSPLAVSTPGAQPGGETGGGAPAGTPSAGAAGEGRSGPAPEVPVGRPVDEYATSELDAVVQWICSDDLLRTHDELAAAARRHLGFTRRGRRIDAALDSAIARVRAEGTP
jgi:hypothetical protein